MTGSTGLRYRIKERKLENGVAGFFLFFFLFGSRYSTYGYTHLFDFIRQHRQEKSNCLVLIETAIINIIFLHPNYLS
ncbi:hypothetical protein F4823DRAFT_572081 [Ustulina deusta]|nr:hypothetical protein F4823DRAFT_572081 [Ustulina deusta]